MTTLAVAVALSALVGAGSSSVGGRGKPHQPLRERGTRDPASAAPGMVTINYPDTANLASFVDYVSQRLNIKIVYGDELRNQTVVFRPGEFQVPADSLLDLLRSMLRMHELALVEGDIEGWLRIVSVTEMQRHVQAIRASGGTEPVAAPHRVVTEFVAVAPGKLAEVSRNVRPFLSSAKASVMEVPERGLLIITDYEAAIGKALEVIRLFDAGPRKVEVRSLEPRHVSAAALSEQISRILTEKARLESGIAPQVALYAEPRSGRLLMVGAEDDLAVVGRWVEEFDAPDGASRAPTAYSPRFVSAARVGRLVTSLLMSGSNGRDRADMKVLVDEETNRIYVTAPPDVQEQVRRLLETEDVPSAEASRPLRIYRPRNRQAKDLIGILSQVLPNVTTAVTEVDENTEPKPEPKSPPGPNRPPVPQAAGELPPTPPAVAETQTQTKPPVRTARTTRVEGKDFSLSHDDHTNSIIAIGPHEFHHRLQGILNQLDLRRPQVLVEMTLVAVTFNDSLSLAVELANEERHGELQSILFSAFGLSDIDVATGVRTLNPGAGVNGIVIGPHETPFVFRAIAAHGNSRIIATPKIVVDDGTSGTIGSVEESPFTSINASNTVATTSFAGYESAGTTLTVTPHVSQVDHLSLAYSLSFSNFTGSGSVGVPPPRTSNTFSGSVVVPDAHTVILGGLVTENEADSTTEVPLLGRIPVVGALFQSSDRARTKSRVFAFIRPTILRDDQFADLKMASETERDRAAIGDRDYPASAPAWMR